MKREINCPKCIREWETIPEFAGETRRRFDGPLLHSCVCDGCGVQLPAGSRATTVCLWSDYMHPNGPPALWEDEYLATVDVVPGVDIGRWCVRGGEP